MQNKIDLKKTLENCFSFASSFVDYDENRSYCNCDDDYCKCTTVNPILNSVNYKSIIANIKNYIKTNKIQQYCIERAVYKIIDLDSFNIDSCSGYYGEETEVTFLQVSKSKLIEAIKTIMEQSSTKAIELVLELEYGYVLDELKNKDWFIIDVPISSIKAPYAKINNKIVDQYTGDEIILCQTLGNKNYRLIDGNHRFSSAKKNNKKEVKILTTKEDNIW